MAAKHNIVIEQGATFPLYVTWKDPAGNAIDLTGFRVRMQVRQTAESASTLVDFDSDDLAAGESIDTLDDSGVISIKFAPSVTTSLTFKAADWDLTVESPGGEVTRLLEGKASVSLGVTR